MDLMEYVSLGLALLAVGVILLAYMRRRRRAMAESEKRIGQARRRRFLEVAQEQRLGLPRRNRDCPPDGMGNIVTDDPLAEAEAYLTRGRGKDAESVLKEAIAQDPSRYTLKLELLAIYRQRHDASSFDPLAEELYAELGGRCLNPHNRVPRADLSHHSASKISSVTAKSWRKVTGDNMHGGGATQTDVSAIRDYSGVERRKRSRRTIAHHRDATSWRPNAVNRRQTRGRRWGDRL